MHVNIVYAHPSSESFTREARDVFIKGLNDAGHTYEMTDLYAMHFVTDMNEAEYLRESHYRSDIPVPADVQREQEKINRCDVLAFVYPVFWTEAPAKLVGWFDRVWTYGFAYGDNAAMKTLSRAIFLCIAGATRERLEQCGHLESMKTVMVGDRIFNRARTTEFVLLHSMSRSNPKLREENRQRHLAAAYQLGKDL
jgi:NAD(P)H dehydrogenase (quinone)